MSGKEIIEIILDYLGVKAPTFAATIGVKYQRILDIKIGKTKKISADLGNAIVSRYRGMKETRYFSSLFIVAMVFPCNNSDTFSLNSALVGVTNCVL